jgi:hypothetical protein
LAIFGDFRQKKLRVFFSKANVLFKMLRNITVFCVKRRQFFRRFLSAKIFQKS